MTAWNPDPLPGPTGQKRHAESLCLAVVQCVGVGLGVGVAGIPLCISGYFIFYGLRDLGNSLLLFLIPVGALGAWPLTRKYLLQKTSRLRGAVTFGIRYFFLGAFVGFYLTAWASSVAFNTFLGGSIGIVLGGLGGAFQGWLDGRKKDALETDRR